MASPPPPSVPFIPPPPPPPMPGTFGAKPMPSWKETNGQSSRNDPISSGSDSRAGVRLPGMDEFTQQQFANLPEKLLNTMGKEKKPFTYTPHAGGGTEKGKLDLSEIKSSRMKKRIMANLNENENNGGVPNTPQDSSVGMGHSPGYVQTGNIAPFYGETSNSHAISGNEDQYSSSLNFDPSSGTGYNASFSLPPVLPVRNSSISFPPSTPTSNPYQPTLPKPYKKPISNEFERNMNDQLDELSRSIASPQVSNNKPAWRPVTSPMSPMPSSNFPAASPFANHLASSQMSSDSTNPVYSTHPVHPPNHFPSGYNRDDACQILRNISDGIQEEMDKLTLAEQQFKRQLSRSNSKDENNNQGGTTEPRYRGDKIPSRSFEILKKITGDGNDTYEGGQYLDRQNSIRQPSGYGAPRDIETEYVPPSQRAPPPTPPVYLGRAIPSKSFKLLQMMTGEQPVYNESFSAPFRDYSAVYSPHGTEI